MSEIVNILCCPNCSKNLTQSMDSLVCTECDRNYPVENGIHKLKIKKPHSVDSISRCFFSVAEKFHDTIAPVVADEFFGRNVSSDNKNDFIAFSSFLVKHYRVFELSKTGADLGCGLCKFSLDIVRKQPHLKMVGVDISSETLSYVKNNPLPENFELIESNLLDVKFIAGSLDFILCSWVMQFLSSSHEINILIDIANHSLREGGHIILADNLVGPDGSSEGGVYRSEETWMKKYGKTPMEVCRHIWRPDKVEACLYQKRFKLVDYSEGSISWFILAQKGNK